MSSAIYLIKPTIEEKIEAMIAQMTVEEKAGQLNQINTVKETNLEAIRQGRVGSFLNATSAFSGLGSSPSASADFCNSVQHIAVTESRLKIPLIFGRDVIHGYRTVFPIPLGQAASFDPELIEEAASIAAAEASSDGIKWTFAPMIDVARDARWGRIAEGFGEDPCLCATLAAAMVRGFQGDDMADPHRLVACAKHFLGYGAAEGGRDYDSAEISMRTLRDIYLPPYKAAVIAGVGTIMAAFHDLNGIPMSANPALLTQLLKEELGFKGFVVSDWGAVGELVPHGLAQNRAEAASLALSAGIDMDMVAGVFIENLPTLLNEGLIHEGRLDEAVRRVLRIKFLAGLFDQPYTDPKMAGSTILTAANRKSALELAQQSIVLLKNENGLLPFDERIRRIAVIGPLAHARRELYGTWTPDGRAEDATPLYEAIRETAPKSVELRYAEYADEAIRLAGRADAAVIFVGEHPVRSGENSNVADLNLPPGQRELVEAVSAQGLPVVLVVIAGRSLAIQRETQVSKAVLYAWHPGIEGGHAIGNILFGRANPSGKLPVTLPRLSGQVPIYYNHKNSGRPIDRSIYFSRYVDTPSSPLFPFGFGLGYTRFTYNNLEIASPIMIGQNDISANVTNAGSRPGTEIVQLYIRDLVGSVTRPVKELKGFQRVTLAPGETRQVSFNIRAADLSFTGPDDMSHLEPGDYQVWIGGDSSSGLQSNFKLEL